MTFEDRSNGIVGWNRMAVSSAPSGRFLPGTYRHVHLKFSMHYGTCRSVSDIGK
jgi:hypothetical protein